MKFQFSNSNHLNQYLRLLILITFLLGFSYESKAQEDKPELNTALDLNNKGAAIITTNPEEAVRYFKAAHDLDPKQPDYVNNIGVVRLNEGKFDEAIIQFLRAVEIAPNYYRGFYNLGVCYQKQGKHQKAVDSYLKGQKISDTPEINFNLGIVYTRLGDKVSAEKSYQNFIKIAPKDQMAQAIRDAEQKIKELQK
ncbi:tetratricopeptide repeat protein [Leptospira sp. 'Mane']|uniref:tetratricopeptide repeat protein n=1 Tax=Leptospira sp. 'Mane' TaxID=3387407 RepID=UPI00398B32FC